MVDDDDELRSVLAEALVDEGYDVVTASNGLDALEYVRQQPRPLNLVLLDLMMPIMDGRTFLRECRTLPWWIGVPVVVLSAAYRAQSLTADLGPDVRATLAKPFDLTVVLALAARLTSRATCYVDGTQVDHWCSASEQKGRGAQAERDHNHVWLNGLIELGERGGPLPLKLRRATETEAEHSRPTTLADHTGGSPFPRSADQLIWPSHSLLRDRALLGRHVR